MPVFERDLIAFESLEVAGGGPVKLHLADVTADLHSIGARVHAERASDGSGDADEAFHAAQVVFRAEGDGAAEVGCGVNLGKIAIEHDVGLRRDELQHHPGEFAVADEKVRAATEKLVRNALRIEKAQKIRNRLVLFNAQQVGRATDA